MFLSTVVKSICLTCYYRSFKVSGLMFKSLIHFELIFVSGVSQGSSLILLPVAVWFSQYFLLKRLETVRFVW